MFEQYTYKKKFIALTIIFIMLSITAYKRSFNVLFDVIRQNKELTKNVEELELKAKNSDQLIQEVAALDKLIGKEGMKSEEVQQQIVNFATNNANVSINDLKPIHIADDDNYVISTNQIDVTGNVNQLLQLGYAFEKDFDLSRLASMNFYTTKKNNKTEVLHLKMIFQNYGNTK
ncbi:MAG: hypothetical protein V4670_11735 [Bacteroidota bacterium]